MTLKNLAIFAVVAAVLYWLFRKKTTATTSTAGGYTYTRGDEILYTGSKVGVVTVTGGSVNPAPTPDFGNVITYTGRGYV